MPRKYRSHRIHRDKYSIEQTNVNTSAISNWVTVVGSSEDISDSKQTNVSVIAPVPYQGKRKVKHLTISMCNVGTSDNIPLIYSLVYVPQGYTPQPILFPEDGFAQNNYEANQFVMSSGVIDFSAGPCRIKSRLARNLNSGDSIYLILATNTLTSSNSILAQVSYAISYQ